MVLGSRSQIAVDRSMSSRPLSQLGAGEVATHRSERARALGMERTNLHKRIRALGIERER